MSTYNTEVSILMGPSHAPNSIQLIYLFDLCNYLIVLESGNEIREFFGNEK